MCKQNGLLVRGTTFYFQARVPMDCREQIGKTVIREKLPAATHAEAVAQVRQKWAALHQRLERLRAGASDPSEEDIQRYADAWLAMCLQEDEEERLMGVDDTGFDKHQETLDINNAGGRHALARGDTSTIEFEMEDFLEHRFDVKLLPNTEVYRKAAYAFLKASVKATEMQLARHRGEVVDTPKAAPAPAATLPSTPATPAKAAEGSSPPLSAVIKYFLDNYDQVKQPAMYKKHSAVLPVFLQCIGDRPVGEIKQLDIENFCKMLLRLPPRWADQMRQKKVTSIHALAALEHPKTISPKTFEDTYIACVRPFLSHARRIFGDAGFPAHLTTEGITYRGAVDAGENEQRALTAEELQSLVEALRPFANDARTVHMLWLPMVALYSGARVNEIAQINPQIDIGASEGVPYFHFTDETEADPRVIKSIKNKSSIRKLPIHPDLLRAGFMQYAEAIKATGAKLLFPLWTPSAAGRASTKAETWFRGFLKDAGLRDDTPGKRVAGFHTFRSTFLARGSALRVADAPILTGHTGDTTAVVRKYQGELPLPQKLVILKQITFEFLRWPDVVVLPK